MDLILKAQFGKNGYIQPIIYIKKSNRSFKLTCLFYSLGFISASSTKKITSPAETSIVDNSSSASRIYLNDFDPLTFSSHTARVSRSIPPSLSASDNISFTLQLKEYNIKVYSDQSGVIEQIKTEPKLSDIKYELLNDQNDSNELQNKLSIDAETGVLRLEQTINPGDYVTTVKASLVPENSSIMAKVKLKVLGVVCDEKHEPLFLNAFLKMHITENKADVILPETPISNCKYLLTNQQPSGDFFNLNSVTGKLESKDTIDRESEIFRHQVQAHISLEISINCSSTNQLPVNTPNQQSNDSHVQKDKNQTTTPTYDQKLSKKYEHHCFDASEKNTLCDSIIEDKITYNTHIMKLLIIIDDANDNNPEFSEAIYFFGYPDKTLVNKILPNSLGSVHAIDKDVGLNAAIKYSVENTSQIIIDSCTGVVYPNPAQFKYEKMTFKVTATDRAGEPDGLSKSVFAQLEILQGVHIMKMLVKRSLEESKEDIIINMQKYLNLSVKVLKIDTVPPVEDTSESIELNNVGQDILEYYMVYAHKDQTLVTMNMVAQELKKSKELSERILWTSVSIDLPAKSVHHKSFFTFIVVVTLLLSIGGMVFYMLFIRTGNYAKCFNWFKKSDSTKGFESNEGSIITSDYVVSLSRMQQMNPTFNYLETDTCEDLTPDTPREYRKASTQINAMDELCLTPTILVTPNSRRNSYGGEENLGLSSSGMDNNRGRRKSTVSFNEIVEQFHTVHN